MTSEPSNTPASTEAPSSSTTSVTSLKPSELQELLRYLTPHEKDQLDRLLMGDRKWRPLPGPQTLAYRSQADYLYYGGAAGGGKTDLLLGLAGSQHRSSIIFRRDAKQLQKIEKRAEQLYGHMGTYHGQDKVWTIKDDGGVVREIEFGGVHDLGDEQKYMGWPNDLKAFDEVPHFTEYQFRFLTGWTRTTIRGQRTRVVAAGNPPIDSEGDWVISFWAPWLDPHFPNPAQPGELRWFTVIDDKNVWVDDGTPFLHKGEMLYPKSITFIPAFLSDNPYQDTPEYRGMLQALPEPLRSKLSKGDYSAGREDNAWQVIPTEWVQAAQERWNTQQKPVVPLSKLGCDVARGGKDRTVITPRYGTFFGQQITQPGANTPNGGAVVALLLQARGDSKCCINVDGIGVGTSVVDICMDINVPVKSMVGSEGSEATDRTGTLGFANKRAEWWWGMREALDPVNGDFLALPPDRELLSDLCAPRYSVRSGKILIEKKEDVVKRIGRSTDKGDSCVYARAEEAPSSKVAFGSV